MTKRELIDKTRLLSEKMKSKYYHLANGDTAIPIIDIEHSPIITEQEIVKPYLDRLKRKMHARDNDNGGEPLNAVDRGYHLAYEHLCEEIDNILSEKEEEE